MRIKYENNTVTIDTGIAASLLDGAKSGILKCKDDKGNDVYAVAKTERADALSGLTESFFPVNAVSTEGNAMLVAVVPMDVTVEVSPFTTTSVSIFILCVSSPLSPDSFVTVTL